MKRLAGDALDLIGAEHAAYLSRPIHPAAIHPGQGGPDRTSVVIDANNRFAQRTDRDSVNWVGSDRFVMRNVPENCDRGGQHLLGVHLNLPGLRPEQDRLLGRLRQRTAAGIKSQGAYSACAKVQSKEAHRVSPFGRDDYSGLGFGRTR